MSLKSIKQSISKFSWAGSSVQVPKYNLYALKINSVKINEMTFHSLLKPLNTLN